MGLGGPEGGGGGGAFTISTVNNALHTLTLGMSNFPVISGPAADPTSYVLTTSTGFPSQVTAVHISGQNLILTTTEQTIGDTYTLTMPFEGLVDVSNDRFDGPFAVNFTGVGQNPTVNMVRGGPDIRHLEIIFSEGVIKNDATNPDAYSISPPLEIVSIKQFTDFHYSITTSKQVVGGSYGINIVGTIRDLFGNPIL